MPDADEAVAADLKHILRLKDIEQKMGGMLVARTSDGPKNTESHCQELSVERLASEPVESPQTLGPFLLYSFLCPCPSCAQKISEFAIARKSVGFKSYSNAILFRLLLQSFAVELLTLLVLVQC